MCDNVSMAVKILIVEDSRTFRQQLTIVLESRGHRVISAEDGEEGLMMLKANPDVAMVITDVNMPNMDGLEMVEKIKKEGHFRGPIIVLTTAADRDSIQKGRGMGIDCWAVKPFEPAVFLSAIDKVLNKKPG